MTFGKQFLFQEEVFGLRMQEALLKGELSLKATEGWAVPGTTCYRQAEPAPTCCCRIEREFGKHTPDFPNSALLNPTARVAGTSPFRGGQLVKKGFDKLVDGEASSPATATLSSFC